MKRLLLLITLVLPAMTAFADDSYFRINVHNMREERAINCNLDGQKPESDRDKPDCFVEVKNIGPGDTKELKLPAYCEAGFDMICSDSEGTRWNESCLWMDETFNGKILNATEAGYGKFFDGCPSSPSHDVR